MPASAGDLVIWRQEIPHGASANTSDRPRLAQYVTMYPMHWPDERVGLTGGCHRPSPTVLRHSRQKFQKIELKRC